jgi:parallel beta-helix repeat protein
MKQKRLQFKSLFFCSLTLSLILISENTFGAIINVPTPAYPTIQAGIDAANPGDTILVANGTFTGPGNRNIDFSGKAITVRSVGGPENCIIDVEGSYSNPGRGFYFHSGEGEDSVLSGFTVTGGHGEEFGVVSDGGGIYIDSSCSPKIDNCIIKSNVILEGHGGGVFSLGAPEISNCIVENNKAFFSGGGIYTNGSAIIRDCIIRDNRANINGAGGISIGPSGWTTISNCSIINNYTWTSPGGIGIYGSADIINCLIEGNRAANLSGGGIVLYNSLANITNCTIINNYGYASGGGISIQNSSPNITGCSILGNSTWHGGGGISISGSSPRIINCNILGNRTSYGGGVSIDHISSVAIINSTISSTISDWSSTIDVKDLESALNITNSIIWGYLAFQGQEMVVISGDFDPNLITYSNINQDGFEGINGNIRQDPLFVDPDNGDFHLSKTSPCIDAGTSENAPDTDIDGDSRPQELGVDMGADEYFPYCKADFNNDGKVDGIDLETFSFALGEANCTLFPSLCDCDIEGDDDDIDGADLKVLTAEFDRTDCADIPIFIDHFNDSHPSWASEGNADINFEDGLLHLKDDSDSEYIRYIHPGTDPYQIDIPDVYTWSARMKFAINGAVEAIDLSATLTSTFIYNGRGTVAVAFSKSDGVCLHDGAGIFECVSGSNSFIDEGTWHNWTMVVDSSNDPTWSIDIYRDHTIVASNLDVYVDNDTNDGRFGIENRGLSTDVADTYWDSYRIQAGAHPPNN